MKNDAHGLLAALLRKDLLSFVLKVANELAPGQSVQTSWYLEAMAHALERCIRGETKRLIINVPPRHLKSIMTSVALVAFLLGRDPSARIVCASYSAELAGKHARDCRRVMQSAWYKELFPGTRIANRNAEMDFETSRKGYRLSTSVGGTLTGRGGNILIVDDPLKPEEALSEARRKATLEWYDNTFYTRMDDKSTGIIIIVMQRLHIDDLVGHVLSKGERWDVLSLPATAELDELVPIGPGVVHHRRKGDLLDPKREDATVLATIKENLGSYNFNAQYQQQPIPIDGEIYKASWFRQYDVLPKTGWIVQSWDTAMKDDELNDYSVCTTWHACKEGYFLVDVFRKKLQFPDLLKAVVAQYQRWNPGKILIEDQSSGTALAQALKTGMGGLYLYPEMIKPEGDKVMRAAMTSALIEAGKAHLPLSAPWLDPFMREVLQFPSGSFDDQVDSMTQFLNWISKPRGGVQFVKIGGV